MRGDAYPIASAAGQSVPAAGRGALGVGSGMVCACPGPYPMGYPEKRRRLSATGYSGIYAPPPNYFQNNLRGGRPLWHCGLIGKGNVLKRRGLWVQLPLVPPLAKADSVQG